MSDPTPSRAAEESVESARSASFPKGQWGDGGASDGERPEAEHHVQFYEDDAFLAAAVGRFLIDGLRADETVLVIATESHQRLYAEQIEASGFNVAELCASERLTFLDAPAALATFMQDGMPEPRLFELSVGSVIARLAASGQGRLRAFGEMVDVLWQEGQRAAALRLEELWNDLQKRQPFTLFCAYAVGNFYKQPSELQRVCGAHTHLVADDGVPCPVSADAVSELLPLYARRLANEVTHRREVEQALRASLRELRLKEEALRQSEEQLRDFVENASIGLHRVSADGVIQWANQAELELLGYSEAEYVGRSISDFHVDRGTIDEMLVRLRRGESLHERGARLRAKDGSIKHVVLSTSVYSRDGEFVHTRCFTRDVTERRQAEEALRHSAAQLRLITDALPGLVAFVDSDQRYLFASAAYERWFGYPKEKLVGKHLLEVLGADAYVIVKPYVERALAGELVIFEAEIPYAEGGARFIEATYVPQVLSDGHVRGFVSLVSDATGRRALERFRSSAAARNESLLHITAAIADAVSRAEVLEAVLDRIAEAVEASSAGLWLVDEEQRAARLVRTRGYGEATQRSFALVPLEHSPGIPAVDSMRTGEPIWIASRAELLERYPHLASAVTDGRAYRICCLPLLARGQVVGALGLTIEGTSEGNEDERDFLLLAARYAGQAIERVRLFEQERRSRADADNAVNRLGSLSRAARVFIEAELDLTPRLRAIAVELGTSLSSTVGISLVQADGLLQTLAVYHPVPEAEELLRSLAASVRLPLGQGITGSVLTTGKSVLLPSIDPVELASRASPLYRPYLERFPIAGLACAPLRVRGQLIGTVMAARSPSDDAYTTEDLHLFEELAEQAAVAIDNGRLYQDTFEARTRAEQLYRFAQAVVAADRVEIVLEAALSAIETALGARRSAILTFDDEGVMRFRAWRNLSEGYRNAVEGHSPWARDTLAPAPVLATDAERDADLAAYADLFRSEGIGALAFFPLVSRGRLLGKFMVYYDSPHVFSPHEVETARAIANHLASVITRFNVVAELEDTIRYNELFAGILAHDLRNPLGAILMAAQQVLMRREGESPPIGDGDKKPLSKILSSGQRMTTMIDQLLDFTRARSGGGIHVEPGPVNLAELCGRARDELELAHPEWNIECEFVGDHHGAWDADRLLQVISNLIANAGQHGSRDAAIQLRLDGTQMHRVKLEVHNGGAIPDSLLPHLFSPFRNARQGRGRSSGLGLGLFIVREIVRAHGGTVDVSSSQAAGTKFSIELPRRAQPPAG